MLLEQARRHRWSRSPKQRRSDAVKVNAMKDGRGDRIQLGDTVELWPNRIGRVVCSLDDAQFSPAFSEAEWGHLKKGALIATEDGEIFHYEKADEDFRLLERARPSIKDAIR